ncbi:MAG: hypothetical protein ACUVR0_01355 [Candidatus Aminicenantales bacterium]
MLEDIFRPKIIRCLDLLEATLQSLEAAGRESRVSINQYYRLRNQVREAKTYLEELTKEAHRLFGPAPVYAPPDFEEKRLHTLQKTRLIIETKEKEAILAELIQDEIIKRFFEPEEVSSYVERFYETQSQGKRKLANLKARLIIEKIKQNLAQAESLLRGLKEKTG